MNKKQRKYKKAERLVHHYFDKFEIWNKRLANHKKVGEREYLVPDWVAIGFDKAKHKLEKAEDREYRLLKEQTP